MIDFHWRARRRKSSTILPHDLAGIEFFTGVKSAHVVRFDMRFLCFAFLCLTACSPVTAQDSTTSRSESLAPRTVEVAETAKPFVAAARKRLDALVVYDGRYVALDYPNGDVPAGIGVCTDVVIRSLRRAYAMDLQRLVHEDMTANFNLYPTTWGHTRPDKNIDHRRVPNLEVYLTRSGYERPITARATDFAPGDIVSWRLDGNSGDGGLPHIGIVSDRLGVTGTPLIIHNIGGGVEESDMLFDHRITGHFRISPEV